jgi:hypothetical protein
MFSPCSELLVFMYCTGKSMNNLLLYCGLVDVRINAFDKDLPVLRKFLLVYSSPVYNSRLDFVKKLKVDKAITCTSM